jgi:imidazole glycerol-phosphate synthase subunit HisH
VPAASVVVLDHGGDVTAFVAALESAGANVVVSADKPTASAADGLVIVGDGDLAELMAAVRAAGADQVVDRRLAGGRAVLAVDVGLHAMFSGPGVEGLEEWPGVVEPHEHDGWSTLDVPEGSWLFRGLEDASFRFAHAYAARRFPLLETWPSDTRINAPVVSWAQHDEPFVAAVENGPLTALQLRPELSGAAGATVLTRWVDSLRVENRD